MRLLGQIVHGSGHAIEEEGFCLIPTAVAVWCGD